MVIAVSAWLLSAVMVGAERVTVSVFGLFHPSVVTVEAERPLIVKTEGRERRIATGQRVRVGISGRKIVVEAGESRFSAERVEVSAKDGEEAEFTLAVPGRIHRSYRGRLEVRLADQHEEQSQGGRRNAATDLGQQGSTNRGYRSPHTELVPVVSMELETAVASVNSAEAAPGTPMEALKAQAVAIRSYFVAGGSRHPFSQFCDTTHCQFLKSPPAEGSPAAEAAEATRGLVLAWEGKPFAAMYSASCAGRTHSLAEIAYAQRDYPYFAVECEYCRRHPERWSATISREDAATLAKKTETERLKLGRKLGWNTVPSNDYSAKARGSVVDLSGVGRGHGLGLCERGGAAMAREGKNFREILDHYYPNTRLTSIEPSGSRAIAPSARGGEPQFAIRNSPSAIGRSIEDRTMTR
jgi:peptidoglycan hydrolase-like amidase